MGFTDGLGVPAMVVMCTQTGKVERSYGKCKHATLQRALANIAQKLICHQSSSLPHMFVFHFEPSTHRVYFGCRQLDWKLLVAAGHCQAEAKTDDEEAPETREERQKLLQQAWQFGNTWAIYGFVSFGFVPSDAWG